MSGTAQTRGDNAEPSGGRPWAARGRCWRPRALRPVAAAGGGGSAALGEPERFPRAASREVRHLAAEDSNTGQKGKSPSLPLSSARDPPVFLPTLSITFEDQPLQTFLSCYFFFLIIIIERIPSAAKQSWNLCRTWGVLLSRRRNRSSLLPCSRRVLSWPPEWAWRERLLSYTLQFEHISLKFAA